MNRVRVVDNGYREFWIGLRDLNGLRAKVGVQAADATQMRGNLNMAELMAIHEYGAPRAGIDARMPLRGTLDKNKRAYERDLIEASKRLLRSPRAFNAHRELLIIGEGVREDIVNRMRRGEITPPIKEATARRRGDDPAFAPPLADRGLLMNAISAVVAREIMRR
jgi:hypothetical protein